MNRQTVAEVVARLFTAAGRRATELDYEVWGEALADVRDDVAGETVLTMVRELDLREHFPTPALFRQTSRSIAARRTDERGLPEPSSPETPTEEGKARISQLRKALGDRSLVKRVP